MANVDQPGCEIEVMPDGGRRFHFAEPELSWIRISYQTTLRFGEAHLEIECPFTLKIGDTVHRLDPEDQQGLGPIIGIYPDSIVEAAMAPDGTLTASFAGGAQLTVPPDPDYEAWSVNGFFCMPGGFH